MPRPWTPRGSPAFTESLLEGQSQATVAREGHRFILWWPDMHRLCVCVFCKGSRATLCSTGPWFVLLPDWPQPLIQLASGIIPELAIACRSQSRLVPAFSLPGKRAGKPEEARASSVGSIVTQTGVHRRGEGSNSVPTANVDAGNRQPPGQRRHKEEEKTKTPMNPGRRKLPCRLFNLTDPS